MPQTIRKGKIYGTFRKGANGSLIPIRTKTVMYRKPYVRRVQPARGAKGAFAQKVQTIIRKNQETKFVLGPPTNKNTSGNLSSFTAFTSGITSTNEVYRLIPDVSVGDDDYQRVGNVIQPTSLTTKVNLALFTNSSMCIYADVFFLTSKNVKDYDNTNDIPTGELLNNGAGGNQAYDGASYTSGLPINRSEFTVIAHKRIRLAKGANDPNTACSLGSPAATDTFQHYASFVQKIPMPQKLLYESKPKTQPSNYFPFMMVGFIPADANGNTAPSVARLQVQAQSHMYFKDS